MYIFIMVRLIGVKVYGFGHHFRGRKVLIIDTVNPATHPFMAPGSVNLFARFAGSHVPEPPLICSPVQEGVYSQ